MNKVKGFTLMEIMMGILIIGAMASMAIPRFATTVELYRSKEGVAVLNALLQAQLMADVDVEAGRMAPYDLTTLDIEIPTMDYFNNPVTLKHDGAGLPVNVPINFVSYRVYSGVYRTNGAYALYIQADGTILCDTAVICRKMGYAPW